MIGKGGRDVKHELSLLCRLHQCRCFTMLHDDGTSLAYRRTHISDTETACGQVSRRRHLDGDTVINRLTNLLAHAASDAAFVLNDETQRMKIHRQGLNRALRHAGMAPLPRRTRSMRHGRKAHPHLEGIGHRQ